MSSTRSGESPRPSDSSSFDANRATPPVPPPPPPPRSAPARGETSQDEAKRRELARQRRSSVSPTVIISWVVGGGIGVILALAILMALSEPSSSRRRSNRGEDAADLAASIPRARLPRETESKPAAAEDSSRRSITLPPSIPGGQSASSQARPNSRRPQAQDDAAPKGSVESDDSAVPEEPPVVRVPVPAPEARKEAEDRLREVFREEFAAAVDEETRRSLAVELLRRVEELSGDDVAHFATLKTAYDLAVDADDPALASHAADLMAEKFEIDEIAVRSQILLATADAIRSNAWRIEAGAQAAELARLCLSEGRNDEAGPLVAIAAEMGDAADSDALQTVAASLRTTLDAAAGASAELEAAKSAYDAAPMDVDACERYGTLLCLRTGDWEAGLPLLVLSEDPQLKAAAEQDLAAIDAPSERIAVADAWSLLAERGGEYAGFGRRAKLWYERAEQDATGLDRVHVQKRLEALKTIASADDPEAIVATPLSIPTKRTSPSRDDLWDQTQGASIVSRSPIAQGSDIRSAFGASVSNSPLAPGIKDGALFDAAPGGTVHFVEWTTERHVKIDRIGVVVRNDVKSRSHGNAEALRLYAWDPFAGQFALLVDLPAREKECREAAASKPGLTLLPTTEPGELALTLDFDPVLSNRFRAEFVQAGTSDAKFVGPLVMELDAFAPQDEAASTRRGTVRRAARTASDAGLTGGDAVLSASEKKVINTLWTLQMEVLHAWPKNRCRVRLNEEERTAHSESLQRLASSGLIHDREGWISMTDDGWEYCKTNWRDLGDDMFRPRPINRESLEKVVGPLDE